MVSLFHILRYYPTVPFWISTIYASRSYFFYYLTNTYCLFSDYSHPGGCGMVYHCVLICIFLMANGIDHLFMCYWHLYPFWRNLYSNTLPILKLGFHYVPFSRSVMSDSLRPHGLQHARPTWPSRTPGVYPNSTPLVGDAIQPFHPLSSPSPLAFNLSQHQALFQWVSSSHWVAKVLEFQLQHHSFQWILRTPLEWTGWISLQSKGLSWVFSNTTVKSINSLVLSFLYSPTHIHIWLWVKP